MAGALALQAMMLGLPQASAEDSDMFWRVRRLWISHRSDLLTAAGCVSQADLIVT